MATKKKEPEKKPKPAKEKLAPLPCKCGKRAVVLKSKTGHMAYCVDAYCKKSSPVWGSTEKEAIKKWNEEAAKK